MVDFAQTRHELVPLDDLGSLHQQGAKQCEPRLVVRLQRLQPATHALHDGLHQAPAHAVHVGLHVDLARLDEPPVLPVGAALREQHLLLLQKTQSLPGVGEDSLPRPLRLTHVLIGEALRTLEDRLLERRDLIVGIHVRSSRAEGPSTRVTSASTGGR